MKGNRNLLYTVWAYIFPLLYLASFLIPNQLQILSNATYRNYMTYYMLYYIVSGTMLAFWFYTLTKVSRKICNIIVLLYSIMVMILCSFPFLQFGFHFSALWRFAVVNMYSLLFIIGILVGVLIINNFMRKS